VVHTGIIVEITKHPDIMHGKNHLRRQGLIQKVSQAFFNSIVKYC